jgi:hypothetical protein
MQEWLSWAPTLDSHEILSRRTEKRFASYQNAKDGGCCRKGLFNRTAIIEIAQNHQTGIVLPFPGLLLVQATCEVRSIALRRRSLLSSGEIAKRSEMQPNGPNALLA